MNDQGTNSQNAEIIPTFSTSEIILKVTKIPPLDVFYILCSKKTEEEKEGGNT